MACPTTHRAVLRTRGVNSRRVLRTVPGTEEARQVPSWHIALTCPKGAGSGANRCPVLSDLEILKRNLKFRFLLYSPCSSIFQFIEIKLCGINKIPWGPRLSHGPPFGTSGLSPPSL